MERDSADFGLRRCCSDGARWVQIPPSPPWKPPRDRGFFRIRGGPRCIRGAGSDDAPMGCPSRIPDMLMRSGLKSHRHRHHEGPEYLWEHWDAGPFVMLRRRVAVTQRSRLAGGHKMSEPNVWNMPRSFAISLRQNNTRTTIKSGHELTRSAARRELHARKDRADRMHECPRGSVVEEADRRS